MPLRAHGSNFYIDVNKKIPRDVGTQAFHTPRDEYFRYFYQLLKLNLPSVSDTEFFLDTLDFSGSFCRYGIIVFGTLECTLDFHVEFNLGLCAGWTD